MRVAKLRYREREGGGGGGGGMNVPSSKKKFLVVVCYENTGAVYGSLFLRARWVRQRGLCAMNFQACSKT